MKSGVAEPEGWRGRHSRGIQLTLHPSRNLESKAQNVTRWSCGSLPESVSILELADVGEIIYYRSGYEWSYAIL
jgi:hypothetical protein